MSLCLGLDADPHLLRLADTLAALSVHEAVSAVSASRGADSGPGPGPGAASGGGATNDPGDGSGTSVVTSGLGCALEVLAGLAGSTLRSRPASAKQSSKQGSRKDFGQDLTSPSKRADSPQESKGAEGKSAEGKSSEGTSSEGDYGVASLDPDQLRQYIWEERGLLLNRYGPADGVGATDIARWGVQDESYWLCRAQEEETIGSDALAGVAYVLARQYRTGAKVGMKVMATHANDPLALSMPSAHRRLVRAMQYVRVSDLETASRPLFLTLVFWHAAHHAAALGLWETGADILHLLGSKSDPSFAYTRMEVLVQELMFRVCSGAASSGASGGASGAASGSDRALVLIDSILRAPGVDNTEGSPLPTDATEALERVRGWVGESTGCRGRTGAGTGAGAGAGPGSGTEVRTDVVSSGRDDAAV